VPADYVSQGWISVLSVENENHLGEKQNQAGINMRIPMIDH
jgi:hypothetical protein